MDGVHVLSNATRGHDGIKSRVGEAAAAFHAEESLDGCDRAEGDKGQGGTHCY
jgi:hypothetical protein